MENTDTNYTTKKTLMDFLKANIDVHINYLLYLNTLKDIKTSKGFMEVAPLIESLREKLYQAFAYDFIPNNTKQINLMIIKKIEELLDAINLSEVKEFIGFCLQEEDIINLSTTLFLRRSVPTYSINQEETKEKELISLVIEKMQKDIPKTSIDVKGDSFTSLSFFLESLRIQAKKGESLIEYIYDFICHANFIASMTERIDDIHPSCEGEFLRKELFESLYITSAFSLANLIDELNYNLKTINKKENKDITLEKRM